MPALAPVLTPDDAEEGDGEGREGLVVEGLVPEDWALVVELTVELVVEDEEAVVGLADMLK